MTNSLEDLEDEVSCELISKLSFPRDVKNLIKISEEHASLAYFREKAEEDILGDY